MKIAILEEAIKLNDEIKISKQRIQTIDKMKKNIIDTRNGARIGDYIKQDGVYCPIELGLEVDLSIEVLDFIRDKLVYKIKECEKLLERL
jgi:hypothetical protein